MNYQSELLQRYSAISERSFKSKLDIYLFQVVTEDGGLSRINLTDFANYKVKQPWIKYFEEAWQVKEGKHPEFSQVTLDKLDLTIESWLKKDSELIDEMRKAYIIRFQQEQLTVNQFRVLYPEGAVNRICHYCKSSEVELNSLRDQKLIRTKSYRGDKLEIDRKEPNEEYYFDNLVLSCYWCNNAKTDEFSAGEFELIGETIKSVWDNRKSVG
jgi:hypothetical protein